MSVEHFLSRRLADCEKEVHSFAFHAAFAQSGGHALRHAKHLRPFLFSQVCQVSSMSVRNDQHVAGIDRLNIHECRAEIILMNETYFEFT